MEYTEIIGLTITHIGALAVGYYVARYMSREYYGCTCRVDPSEYYEAQREYHVNGQEIET